MKKIIIIFIALSIAGCKGRSADDVSVIVQLCLDKIHQDKDYNYLEQSNLILVKNQYSVNLKDLHLGNKKLFPIDVAPQDIKPYGSAKDVVDNKRHIVISNLSINGQTATVTMKLANVNQILIFKLIKKGSIWQVETVNFSIS